MAMTTIPPDSSGEHRLKILYIQPGTTTFAGIERVVDAVCHRLSETYPDEFDIDVLYVSAHENRPSGDRKYKSIDCVATGRIELMRVFRRVIGAKDYSLVVVPQIEPAVICMVSCLGMRRKFAVHLHGNPRFERSHIKAKLLFLLMRTVFLSRVSSVFGTSPRQLEAFKGLFNSTRPQYWLPNPVRKFENAASGLIERTNVITFVNVGRFSHQKGQDILLAAFDRVCKQRSDVRLRIVGHGREERGLRAQIALLGLQERVDIEHYPDNPQPVLLAGDVYVSTSRWEGWSLAICEALRFGLPVVATDCEFGPSDILIDDRLGRLVPVNDVAGLAEAMLYYCDHLAAEKVHAEFRKEFIDRFSEERVVEVHAQALRRTIHA